MTLPARADGPDLDLLAALGAALDAALEPLVPAGEPVALAGFPNHPNVGDALIWLGQRAWLERRGCPVVHVGDRRGFSARAVRRRLGGRGLVLISGGGNLGDLWPEQRIRERVVAELPRHRIVQLTQSAHFESAEAVARARRSLGVHEDLHVLCRDAATLALVRDELGLRAVPAPDLAFALGPLAPEGEPDLPLLYLSRTDCENAGARLAPENGGALLTDWLGERSPGWLARHALAVAGARGGYDRLALERAEVGLRLVSRTRALVTDRLHGHVLAVLLGVPHVAVDTGHGKLAGLHAAWTSSSQIARLERRPPKNPATVRRTVRFALPDPNKDGGST